MADTRAIAGVQSYEPMSDSLLQFLARRFENVVKYDANGVPSIFVKFPKMKSSELHSSLPDHTHPAFIINGVEQDYILIGKYLGCCLDEHNESAVYSLPNMPPMTNTGIEARRTKCMMNSNGTATACAMTMADHGFLLLLAHKFGWDPAGNDSDGISHNEQENYSRFKQGTYADVNELYIYQNALWKTNKSHTIDSETVEKPDKMPELWKMVRRIGGIPAEKDNSAIQTTLTGSGPLSWYLNGNLDSMCDIVGNQAEICYGYRVVDGEIQIIPNNNAASPDVSPFADDQYRAIYPMQDSDNFELVEPGTPGTLHWAYSDDGTTQKYRIDTLRQGISTGGGWSLFSQIYNSSTRVPYVPYILKELGIYPVDNTAVNGGFRLRIEPGTQYPVCGGCYNRNAQYAFAAGIAETDFYYPEETEGTDKIGVRLRYTEE